MYFLGNRFWVPLSRRDTFLATNEFCTWFLIKESDQTCPHEPLLNDDSNSRPRRTVTVAWEVGLETFK